MKAFWFSLKLVLTIAVTFLLLYAIGETFNLMWLAGLNLMSLGGLAVAIGLIIDDKSAFDIDFHGSWIFL